MEDRRHREHRLAHDPVAIVGIAGMFPKARDIRDFWDNIVSGRDCTDEVPAAWWETGHYYDPDPFAPDRTYCRRGGFLAPVAFDPMEFGMPPKALDSTGLVQLLALTVARDVLRDAANGRTGWHDPARTGVVLGACGFNSTVLPLAARLLAPPLLKAMLDSGVPEDGARRLTRAFLEGLPHWTEDSFPGILANVVSGRVANRLDLRAANHTVDAACASSLAALRAAVDELTCRRADVMLAGGCDADNSVVSFMCFSKTPALSLTGRVRPFDEAADGTLIGEGLGMLALKRLADAERDQDRIYAVLRGLGSSSDGIAKSIYAPCGEGQLTALRRAYEDAGCPPRTVELIEAHGTGTPAGDEVELTALNTLLADTGERRCTAVGSVKSQIGHTKAAAGAAGLIKAALALHHKVLPPTINVTTPSASAREDGAVYVNTAARPWIRDPARPVRRAGVSSFGFGGVNYHAVLEEYAPGGASTLHRVPRACLWHAEDPGALQARIEHGDDPDDGPVPAAHARLGFVADGDEQYAALRAEADARLRENPDGGAWRSRSGIHYRRTGLPPDTRVGALFTGQGSQYVDMGLRSLLAVPPLREAFDAANALFPPGDTLARTVFPPPCPADDAAADRLNRTDYAQPAVGALAAGQYRFLRELGLAPHGLLGHSFGELTALWAGGVLDDEAFHALAHARGQALRPRDDGSDPGGMAAVRTTEDRLAQLLSGRAELLVCNRNAPEEHVIGGPTRAVDDFLAHCAEQAVPAVRLPVAAAFHTPLVEHATAPFAAACARAEFKQPSARVYAGTAGAAYGAGADADRATLVGQLRTPVDFAARLREMRADGIRVLVEFGPRDTLSRLARATLGEDGVETVACDRGPAGDSALTLKEAALRLAVLGLPLTGINRYDAPARPASRKPSSMARLLEGPNFAANAAREAAERRGPAEVPAGWTPPVPILADDPLAEAAAAHLAAHVRYMNGQLATAQELTALLRAREADGGIDEAFAAAVTAISEHGLAVGEAHTRAGEVVAELLRDGAGSPPPAPLPRPAQDEPERAERPAEEAGEPGTREPAPVSDTDRSALAELLANDGGMPQHAVMSAADIDIEEAERVCRGILAEKTGYDPELLEPDMLIQEDLGIDSLKQVEIAAEVWRHYPVIKREELFRFSEARTVGDLGTMLREVLTGPRGELRHSGAVPFGRAYVGLRTLPPVDVQTDAYRDAPRAVLLDDGGELCTVTGETLRGRGWDVRRLLLPGAEREGGHARLRTWNEDELAEELGAFTGDDTGIDLCVLPVSRTSVADAGHAVARLAHAVLVAKHTREALKKTARTGKRAAFVTVTRLDGALGHAGSGADPVEAAAGGLAGLVKTVALEAAPLFCRAVDLAPGMDTEAVAEAFAQEISDAATDITEVAHDGAQRRTPVLSGTPDPALAAAPAGPGLTEDDTLLVTGGGSGIAAWCVTALAEDVRCGFLLLGRTPLTDEPAWAQGLTTPQQLLDAATEAARTAGQDVTDPGIRDTIAQELAALHRVRTARATLDTLRALGARADYLTVDVRDADAVTRALAPHASRITGVIHAAGVLRDRPLSQMTEESIAPVIGTKLSGLYHVLGALDPGRLRHLVVFSSVSGLWGNVRQADYALANEALTRAARALRAAHPGLRATSMVWGPWEGGMADRVHRLMEAAGVPVLSRETGTAHFRACAGPDAGADGSVVVGPLEPVLRHVRELPAGGLTALRSLDGLDHERVLREHRVAGHPLVPMTVIVGAALHVVERAQGGHRTVVRCRDARVARGLYLDGHHTRRLAVHVVPQETEGDSTAHVSIRRADGRGGQLHFEARFQWAEHPGEPPRLELPPYEIPSRPHSCYADELLFHGPSLAGLREVLEQDDRRLVVPARLRDPDFAAGAYGGRLYSPCLADLLVQAAALVSYRCQGVVCMPVSVECIDLYAPLPDDEEFLIVGEIDAHSALDMRCTITACDTGGRVLQKWSGLRMLNASEEQAARFLSNMIAEQRALGGGRPNGGGAG
ncbi:SDR family NAD(P)-dependent oxidoreductase [Streptomyces gamaensis]|uniref:SDR family NAD(P)-dependent oxidoreductase n=1 Tax=Streptomyces gamaensis TaxID=1763542 RepID=A0ABW0ZAB2_9ACTN